MFATKTIPAALAALAILGALPAVAASEHDDEAEIGAIQEAKISLTDAIRAAEQRVGGKAIDAGPDDHDGKLRYEVRILTDAGSVQKVKVDAQSGEVVVASEAKRDDDREEHEHEGEDEED